MYIPLGQKLTIIVYTFLIIQCSVTASVIYIRAKKSRELYSLIWVFVDMILWLVLSVIGSTISDVDHWLISLKFTMIPIMFIGAIWLIFTLYNVELLSPKNEKKIIALILLPQILCAWPMFTKKYFHLFIISKVIGEKEVWGVLPYISITLTYIYTIISIVLMLWKKYRNRREKTWGHLLILAFSLPMFLSVLTGTAIIPFSEFDVTPISFSFFSIMISIYIFKYRFVEVVPKAAYELFSTINEAVLIVDKKGRIIKYNPATIIYFCDFVDLKRCVDIESLISQLGCYCNEKESIAKLRDFVFGGKLESYENTIRISISELDEKQFSFCVMPLKSEKGKVIGNLLTFKDVTEFNALTLGKERKRLSDDLHDSLGNSINVISSNLEYALKHTKDTEEIKDCLKVSYAKTTDAFLSMRRIVDELGPIDFEGAGLISALDSLFYKLRMKGINIDFYKNINDELSYNKKYGDAIYFICQEAISNAVVHGQADNINVTLVQTGSRLNLYIKDDGVGCTEIKCNKGLSSMASRVNALGGEFSYGTPSDGGFNIRVSLAY